jgi:hypothetical protein
MDAVVLAHAGGAPEAATVVIPLAVVIWFVIRERKNVRRLREQEEAERGPATSVDSDTGSP